MTQSGARTGSTVVRPRRVFWGAIAALLALLVCAVAVLELVQRPGTPPEPAGAAPLGSVSYSAPRDALFVSVIGSDSAPGTKARPLATVQRAITVARSGQTIVLRAGTYHERVTVTKHKTVTIQPYRREVVWFDGSTVVEGWKRAGALWSVDGWAARFDSSPTYQRGAPDNTEPGWVFLNPDYSFAAHPEQVWIDGRSQRQVATVADVAPGTFAVDEAASKIYLGSDPTGREVRASDKVKALSVQSKDSILRGVGVRRYATSVPGFGTVTVEAKGVRIENMIIEDNATTGLFVAAADAVVSHVTVRDNGLLGMGANYADRLRVTGLASSGNNREHFNNAPVSGGLKITRSRGVTIERSRFSDNAGPGVWFDQSVYDSNVVGNDIHGNRGHGLILEISAKFVVAGNRIFDNRDSGIKVNDTSNVQIWNNTVTTNGRDLSVVQDDRRASDTTIPGHDRRPGLASDEMPWVVGAVTVKNNVFSGAKADCVVCVEDYSGEMTAKQMGVILDGNAYQRQKAASPRWLVVWSRGQGSPHTYRSLKAFQTAAKQEKHGAELSFESATKASWRQSATDRAAATGGGRLPESISALLQWEDPVPAVGVK
jgi:parallel beta-helix repeat protein